MSGTLTSPEVIKELINHGSTYSKAIDQDEIGYNKYINFKIDMKKTSTSLNNPDKYNSSITKETFRWHNKEKSSTLDEMDGDYLLAAMIHCVKLQTSYFSEAEIARKKYDKAMSKVSYFTDLFTIMEAEFIDRYGVEVPYEPQALRTMRQFIKDGIMQIKGFNENKNGKVSNNHSEE